VKRSISKIVPAFETYEGEGFLVHRPFPTRTLADFSALFEKTFEEGMSLVEEKGKPFDTAIRDVVILARLKLYGRFFNR
jgi:hypothetical protein